MLGIFNSMILTLGSIILTYTLIVSTVVTAHEGELLGSSQKQHVWSSIWVPLRTLSVSVCSCPKLMGILRFKCFIMWVVVQGVGAADSVWNIALDYLGQGYSIVSLPSNSGDGEFSRQSNTLGDLLRTQVCLQAFKIAWITGLRAIQRRRRFLVWLIV